MSESFLVVNEPDNVHLKYFREADRLNSFVNWPFGDVSGCSREKLAEAGFFYDGMPEELDRVSCFLCYKSLGDWGANDCPWAEHIKHSPKCYFAILKMPEALHSSEQSNIIKKLLETNYQLYTSGNCTFPIVHSKRFMKKLIDEQVDDDVKYVGAKQFNQSQPNIPEHHDNEDGEDASGTDSICSLNVTPDLVFGDSIIAADISDDSEDEEINIEGAGAGAGKIVSYSVTGEISYLKTSFCSLKKSYRLLKSMLNEHISSCAERATSMDLNIAEQESSITKHVSSFQKIVEGSTLFFDSKIKIMDELLLWNNNRISDVCKICMQIVSDNCELRTVIENQSTNLELVRENERLKLELDQLIEENVKLRFERLSSNHETFVANEYFNDLDSSEFIPEATIGGLNESILSLERQLSMLIDGQVSIKKQLSDLTNSKRHVEDKPVDSNVVGSKSQSIAKGKVSTDDSYKL